MSDEQDLAEKPPTDPAPADAPQGEAADTAPGDAADPPASDEPAADGDEGGDLAATPVGHPPPVRTVVVGRGARSKPTVRKGARPVVLVYGGPLDVFTTANGIKFRPGVPTEVAAADADELLTFPHHAFTEATEEQILAAAEDADAKEQEQDDGNP